MDTIRFIVILLLIAAAGGCREAAGPRPAAVASKPEGPALPATYTGTLPCADCPGVVWTLNLYPDSVYYLRLRYLDRGQDGAAAVIDDIGRFRMEREGRALALVGGAVLQRFAVRRDSLVALDRDGRPLESEQNHALRRAADVAALEPALVISGMYSYYADAARLRECRTGRTFPVSAEGDNLSLEERYGAVKAGPDEALVALKARIAPRPRMEGEGLEEMIIPERVLKVWPDDSCGVPLPRAELINTFWALVKVEGTDMAKARPRQEIHFVLEPNTKRVRGFAGCNSFGGTYELTENRISFGPLAATKMYCEEFMAIEEAVLKALGQAAEWKILGETLELYGPKGVTVAVGEARYFQ